MAYPPLLRANYHFKFSLNDSPSPNRRCTLLTLIQNVHWLYKGVKSLESFLLNHTLHQSVFDNIHSYLVHSWWYRINESTETLNKTGS